MIHTVFAVGDLTIQPAGGADAVKNIGDLLSASIGSIYLIAFLITFIMLALGGIAWVTSGGDKEQVEKARNRITNALIGLAIVASTWAVMQIAEHFFGISILNGIQLPSAVDINKK